MTTIGYLPIGRYYPTRDHVTLSLTFTLSLRTIVERCHGDQRVVDEAVEKFSNDLRGFVCKHPLITK